jgi:hypothetical protein
MTGDYLQHQHPYHHHHDEEEEEQRDGDADDLSGVERAGGGEVTHGQGEVSLRPARLVLGDTEVLAGVGLLGPGEHQAAQDLRAARLVDDELPAEQRLNAPFRQTLPHLLRSAPILELFLICCPARSQRTEAVGLASTLHDTVALEPGGIVCQRSTGRGAIRVIYLQAVRSAWV